MFQKKEKRMLQNLMFVKKNFVKRKGLKNFLQPPPDYLEIFHWARTVDIDRLLFRVGKSGAKKLGNL